MADCYVTRDIIRADAIYSEILAQNQDLKVEARVQRKQAECWKPNALGKGDASKALHFLDRAEGCEEAEPSERGEIEAANACLRLLLLTYGHSRARQRTPVGNELGDLS